MECYRRSGMTTRRLRSKVRVEYGLMGEPEEDGKRYHGDRMHSFRVWENYDPKVHGQHLRVSFWNAKVDTFSRCAKFCGHCQFRSSSKKFGRYYDVFQCLGHEVGSAADIAHGERQDRETRLPEIDSLTKVLTGDEDRWEFDVGRSAWVRFHCVPRTTLYVPSTTEAGLPEWEKLQAWAESRQKSGWVNPCVPL